VLQQVAAAVIGNALEWYDFVVFGFFTPVVAGIFFPAASEFSSLLLTTASFGVGFVVRPLGGIAIGVIADRRGRRVAMQLVIALMAIATAMIAFAPTYAVLGVGASVWIVVARMLQGLATGGEFASATAYLIEAAGPGRRGSYGAWQMVGQGLAMLLGALAGALLTHNLAHDQLQAWGWRVPFACGLLIAPVGLWIRRHLQEPERPRGSETAAALGTALGRHPRALAASFLMTVFATSGFYVLIVYMPGFAHSSLGLPLDAAFTGQCVSLLAMVLLTALAGAVSDRVGLRRVMQAAIVLLVVALVPLGNWLVAQPDAARFAAVQAILCGLFGAAMGPFSAAVAEQFSAGIRSTGMAVSYNLAVMIFGGFGPLIVTWLLHATGSLMTPSLYVLGGALAGLAGTLLMREAPEAGAALGRHSGRGPLGELEHADGAR
jgi:MFS family permease